MIFFIFVSVLTDNFSYILEYGDTPENISKLDVEIKEEPFEDDGNATNISCDFTGNYIRFIPNLYLYAFGIFLDPLADTFTAESSKEEQQLR